MSVDLYVLKRKCVELLSPNGTRESYWAAHKRRREVQVGRIEMGNNGRVSSVLYDREAVWRRQKARNVVVAGYARSKLPACF